MQPTKARFPRQRECDGSSTGTRRERTRNTTGIPRECDGNPPMVADQPGFGPGNVLTRDRLPSPDTYYHHRGFFFSNRVRVRERHSSAHPEMVVLPLPARVAPGYSRAAVGATIDP